MAASVSTYDSMAVALAHIDKCRADGTSAPRGKRASERTTERTRIFSQTANWAEAQSLAEDGGWSNEHLDSVRALADTVKSHLGKHGITAQHRDLYGVAGMVPNVALAVAGQPVNMITYLPEPRVGAHGKVIRIVVNVSASAGIDAELMVRRGAAFMVLVEVLTALELSVELWAAESVTADGKQHDTAICLKRAGGSFDRDRLLFALAHPAMLRRVIFALNECEPAHIRRKFRFYKGGGYGRPSRLSDTLREQLKADVWMDAPMRLNDRAVNDPVSFVLDSLEGLGLR